MTTISWIRLGKRCRPLQVAAVLVSILISNQAGANEFPARIEGEWVITEGPLAGEKVVFIKTKLGSSASMTTWGKELTLDSSSAWRANVTIRIDKQGGGACFYNVSFLSNGDMTWSLRHSTKGECPSPLELRRTDSAQRTPTMEPSQKVDEAPAPALEAPARPAPAPEAPIRPAPAAEAPARPGPVEAAAAKPLVPARLYLHAAEIPPPGVGAYGVVALRSKPTSANRHRLLMTCAAYVAYLPPQYSLPVTVSVADQMLTLWPLDEPEAREAKADNCDFIVDHYDLYGGISAIQDAERQGAKLAGVGPFLVGWSPSNARGVPDKVVLVVDLSGFDSQDSFDHAFQFWQRKIVQDPKLWRSGFSWEGLRLAIRDFVDRYGEDVVKVWGKVQ